ncbi:MAG: SHOCT domain-containing protein [Proteobacteria bacterium]|nr:SHOCT domain-containing protein [Pseudomonadota bacterium]
MQDRKLELPHRSMPRPWSVAGLLVGYFCATMTCPPSAHAASNDVIWERGDQIVKLVRQDDDSAAANDHPASITRGEIKAMLETLRFRFADEDPGGVSVQVFTRTDIDNLGKAIATGLDRATPSQDLIFHVISARRLSSGAFARRNRVCAGRVFYRDGKLNIIFGQIQSPYRKKNLYGQISEDFYPRNYGSRTVATTHDVILLPNATVSLYQVGGDVRGDWIIMEAGVAPAASSQDDDSRLALAPTGAAVEAPAKPSTTSTTGNETASRTGDKSAMSSAADVEERLKALKQLRERGLISEDAYEAKMKDILQDL